MRWRGMRWRGMRWRGMRWKGKKKFKRIGLVLYCIGIHSRTHNLEKREKYILGKEGFLERDLRLYRGGLIEEVVTLSTCNRVENYIVLREGVVSREGVEGVLRKLFEPFPEDLLILKGSKASHHLFSVSVGLDSQIFGENEILGQIKKAYQEYNRYGLTGKYLNTLFQKAIYIGKKVRSSTGISKYSVSLFGIILEKMKGYFKDYREAKIFLIGLGQIGRSIGVGLNKKGLRKISISTKDLEKGRSISKELGFNYIAWEGLEEGLRGSDVIISATSCGDYIIGRKHGKDLDGGFKLLIDLAVPRDIDPGLAEDNMDLKLLNVDDIGVLSESNLQKRKRVIMEAEEMIAFENCHYCYNRLNMNSKDRLEECLLGFTNVNQVYKDFKSNYYKIRG